MPLRRKIRSGYIIAFLLLLISYFFIFQYSWKVQREYNWVSDGYKAENKVAQLRNEIMEVETGVRGYYITKDETFLNKFHESQTSIPPIYNELKKIEEKNPAQLDKLDSLKDLIDTRLELMKRNIAAFQKANLQSTPEIEANRQRGQILIDVFDFTLPFL